MNKWLARAIVFVTYNMIAVAIFAALRCIYALGWYAFNGMPEPHGAWGFQAIIGIVIFFAVLIVGIIVVATKWEIIVSSARFSDKNGPKEF